MSDERPLRLVRPGHASAGGSAALVFERIAVIGLGTAGMALALAARRTWPSALVIGLDRNEVLERAIRLHAVDVAAADLTIVSEADLVILAATPAENVERLRALPDHVERSAVVTDTGGPRGPILEAARVLPSRLVFVGGDVRVEGAPAEGGPTDWPALDGCTWHLVTSGASDAERNALGRLDAFVRALGAVPAVMTAEQYERGSSG